MEICSKDSFFLAYERSVSTGRMTEGAMTWILVGIITQEDRGLGGNDWRLFYLHLEWLTG